MTGNSPIGGPNFNQGISRLPSNASGTPAAEAGAQFNTTDAVNLGPSSLAPSGADTRGPAVQAETVRPQAQHNTPSLNNAPNVLTVGDLGAVSHDHHELGLNGIGQPYIETMGGQVIAGYKLTN